MELKFHVPEVEGDVSALVSISDDVRFVYVLGHGAGAGMRHPSRCQSVPAVLRTKCLANSPTPSPTG